MWLQPVVVVVDLWWGSPHLSRKNVASFLSSSTFRGTIKGGLLHRRGLHHLTTSEGGGCSGGIHSRLFKTLQICNFDWIEIIHYIFKFCVKWFFFKRSIWFQGRLAFSWQFDNPSTKFQSRGLFWSEKYFPTCTSDRLFSATFLHFEKCSERQFLCVWWAQKWSPAGAWKSSNA